MGDKALRYLEVLQAKHPGLAPCVGQLADRYQRKLWHQLTVALEDCLALPDLRQEGVLLPFYHSFVATFAHKLNPLRLAQLAVTVAQQGFAEPPQPQEAVAFLEGVSAALAETKQPRLEQPTLFLRMHVAQYQLSAGNVDACKAAVSGAKDELDRLHDVDPSVSAVVHASRSLYYKHEKDFAEFYKSSLLYLAFISSDALPEPVRLSLAVDISLAALLGDNIYNFGELLLHPIIKVLDGSSYKWLAEMLAAFNHGDLHAYDALCERHASALNSQPALVAHERALREKITILCLMELIFNLPAEQRTIPLSEIATRTKLGGDGVEFLLMKTLSLKLIEGVIDQVDSTVQVSWVQPRVLTLEQAGGLKTRLDAWIGKVNKAASTLEEERLGALE
ncbi:hypothetical protein WJX81_003294 [Elliptochloris bilobata]|uniref:PCI domain-containing protein n=1 Tax=Elliptochloris bilobata TaxID=381761 RepID=A0AAW1QM98_9CHLO